MLDSDAVAARSDYSKGFGGKFGVEREKVDKAALGYDYRSETEKHQSQKGEATPERCVHLIYNPTLTGARVCVCVQITHQALEGVTACRPTAWIRSAQHLSDHVIH